MNIENNFNNYYNKLTQQVMKLQDDPSVIDYTWDDSDESLEDLLYYSVNDLTETWCGMPFESGDIVMAKTSFNGQILPHRIFIIDIIIDNMIGPKYQGHLLSSQTEKANINAEYPYNIFIKNYGSIIQPGTGPAPNKDAIIKLDQLYELDNDNFDASSSSKRGKVTKEFDIFIKIELDKIQNHESTKNDYWNNGLSIIY